MQQDVTGHLENGGTFRATNYMVELIDATGNVNSTVDVNDLKGITRSGQTVILKRRKGGDVKITAATLDDAGRLEATLRAGSPQANAPAKSGSGFGRVFKWGCLSTIGLIVVIVIIIVATNTRSDKKEANANAQSSQTSEPIANTTAPANSSNNRLVAGQTANIGDAEVTFNKARILDNDFFKADAGNQYIACEFKVVNTGANEYNLSTILQFEMLDSDSRKFNITVNPDSNGTLDGTIPAAGSVLGEVVFEVPVDKAPYVVRFKKALSSDLAEWTVPQP